MRIPAGFALIVAASLLLGWLAGPAHAEDLRAGTVDLALPRRAAGDEAVWAQVRAGALPRGAQITVSTADGVPVGSVSPVGLRGGQQAANYTIPLPKSAIVNGHVTLHLKVEQPNAAARAPQPGEVESVTLIYVPVSK